MSDDVTRLLESWPYDSEKTTRIVSAGDGRQVLQVRLPLGIEQYELVGRPDGTRPFGMSSVLAYIENEVEQHRIENGTDTGYELSHEQCEMLHDEAILFYYRYLLLFQRNDFERVAVDTEHNLRLCRVLERHCSVEEDREPVLKYKPYIVRINAMARAMHAMRTGRRLDAHGILRSAVQHIEAMDDLDSPSFQFERIRSVNYLKTALKQVGGSKTSVKDRLKKELDAAVEEEDYERAAELRDQILGLNARTKSVEL